MDKKESELVTKTQGFFKRIDDFLFKLTAYVVAGVPIDRHVSRANKIVYSKMYEYRSD